MPELEINPLRNVPNEAVLDAIRADASMEYQRRIPLATDAGISDTVKNLTNHRTLYNEFIDALVNRIGMVIARNTNWTNPLAPFKRGLLTFGDTIEEIQVGLLEAHVYDPDREYMEQAIFGTETPEVQANFHKVNRQNYYKISVNEPMLRRAFLDPNGLTTFVNKLMESPSTSDQWDEFLLTTSLFAKYEANGGFYHVNVPDVRDIESDEADAKLALRKMRAMADTLKFLSTKYNAAKMPTFADASDLYLFVTPEFNAAIDVEALAGAFNIDKAAMHGKVQPIPADQFRVEGAQAILTTKDFFVIADTALETTNQFNPVSRSNNYFLHHHQVVSASRFVPAVMFWTGQDDELITISDSVSSVSTPAATDINGDVQTTVQRGNIYELGSEATMASGEVGAVSYTVTGSTSTKTYVTKSGVLHVGGDEGAGPLVITARSVYVDPSDTRKDPVASTALSLTVAGPVVPEWPVQGDGVTSINIQGIPVPGFTVGDTSYDVALDDYEPPIRKSDIVVNAGGGDANVTLTGNQTDGYTITVSYDPGTGAPVVYTVNVTVV
jgi:hypothetical protein